MTLHRIAFELTTRCNLNCVHCLREVPEQAADLDVGLLDRVLGQAAAYGVRTVVFTGGEPLLHPDLEGVLATVAARDGNFSIVTNGHLLPKRMKLLKRPEFKSRIGHLAVSLEGGDAATHDAVRGPGAYRKAMAALLALKAEGIPAAIKFTIGAHNLEGLEGAVLGLVHLAPAFIEFALMTPTPDNVRAGMALSPDQARRADATVARLGRELTTRLSMSAGAFTPQAYYGCAALCGIELYVDARGRLGFCCMLPGLRGSGQGPDKSVIADLDRTGLGDAHQKLVAAMSAYQRQRIAAIGRSGLDDTDHFPCIACARYFHKLDWIEGYPESPWRLGRKGRGRT
jgi:MoaA/NifB/PqqE/SkfB family radical SAM enzyme